MAEESIAAETGVMITVSQVALVIWTDIDVFGRLSCWFGTSGRV